MSQPEPLPQQPEYNFWEFVACSKCHLPFAPEPGAPPLVPFWVTECGHVICNNHLKADQSCAKCNARNIQVAPLQSEMEEPMANWFAPVPSALDALAFATRFQLETLASLVRYYKRKYHQHRALVERMKADLPDRKVMESTIEDLRAQVEQLQGYPGGALELNDNTSSKRRRLHSNEVGFNSSPRSIATPTAPHRLTLPPRNQPPGSFQRLHHSDDGPQRICQPHNEQASDRYTSESARPGSRRFAEQYAYAPHMQKQQFMAPPALTHNQAHPVRRAQARQQQHPHVTMMRITDTSTLRHSDSTISTAQAARNNAGSVRSEMPPPPVPQVGPNSFNHLQQTPRRNMNNADLGSSNAQIPRVQSFRSSGALSTPHGSMRNARTSNDNAQKNHIPSTLSGSTISTGSLAASRSQTPQFTPSTPSGRTRFVPAISHSNQAGASFTSSSGGFCTPSRNTGGGQRVPFIPGGQPGFQ